MTFPQALRAIEDLLVTNNRERVAPEEDIDQRTPSALGKLVRIALLHLEPLGNWLQREKNEQSLIAMKIQALV